MSILFSKDWTQFTRRIFIKSPVEKVFKSWAIQGGMEEWFLQKAKFYKYSGEALTKGDSCSKGDTFKWTWYGWPDMVQDGEVLECVDGESMSFSFGPAGIVKVVFVSVHENLTELILHQSGIPTDEEAKLNFFYGCSLGWSFWMVNLKAWLEHGIVLDERDNNYDDARKLETVNQ